MSELRSLPVEESDIGKRIDVFLSEQLDFVSRSAAQSLLEQQMVFCNSICLKKNYRLQQNNVIRVTLPDLQPPTVEAEDIPLAIVYEDSDIIVVNKPRGMVVHPAAGNWTGTLVNALLFHCADSLSGINGQQRPGIVHRIDKDTSGLLVVAKNDAAHRDLAQQIAAHTAHRAYQAIVIGAPPDDKGTIDRPIARHKIDRKKMAIDPAGRSAITHYKILRRYSGYTHIECILETGRTHQIRVHMASIGHPVIGDPVYGNPKDRFSNIGGQCLHAAKLVLTHPKTKEKMEFSAPLPQYFTDILAKLEQMQ